MKKSILIILILLPILSTAQSDIVYVPPQSVQDSIFANVLKDGRIKNVGCVFNQINNDEFVVISFEYSNDTPLNALVNSSNRYLQIRNIRIPLVFYTDFRYSTHFNREIDDSSIESSDDLILGGYMCRFNGRFKSGELLFSGWVR